MHRQILSSTVQLICVAGMHKMVVTTEQVVLVVVLQLIRRQILLVRVPFLPQEAREKNRLLTMEVVEVEVVLACTALCMHFQHLLC